ncbi:MAG: hypothetical protein OHK0039_14900 [Bacteroidia bacterium]
MTTYLIAGLALSVSFIYFWSLYRVFEKAGRPGWYALVPIYNVYQMVKISGMAGGWTVLFFIPYVSIVAHIVVGMNLAKAFGKGPGFGVGLGLLGIVFMPLLATDPAQYLDFPAADTSFVHEDGSLVEVIPVEDWK